VAVKKILDFDPALLPTSKQSVLEYCLLFDAFLKVFDKEKKMGIDSNWSAETRDFDADLLASTRTLVPDLLERASKAIQLNNPKNLNDKSLPSSILVKMIATFPALKSLFDQLGGGKALENEDLKCAFPLPLLLFFRPH
jgi:hypothetical protein